MVPGLSWLKGMSPAAEGRQKVLAVGPPGRPYRNRLGGVYLNPWRAVQVSAHPPAPCLPQGRFVYGGAQKSH